MEWAATLNEYEKLVIRMNTPRVVIDNTVCATATLVKIDSARKHGIRLEAVQVLTDLNLCIKKAYISSDGQWFMDVFHVTDQNGNKLKDKSVISSIEQSLETSNAPRSEEVNGLTALELTGTDRQGLLSEVSAVLADLQCAVVEATIWTHNGRIASLVHVKDENSGSEIKDLHKIDRIERRLRNVLKGDSDSCRARTAVSMAVTHTERRLHQMMLADRDYEGKLGSVAETEANVSVQDWSEKGYSVVNVRCEDRPKLLFDIVCTLTDMQYVIFHATIDTEGTQASQEFYIRHIDGSPIRLVAERQRLIQCLLAAIDRRASQGVKLELCTVDRRGLLAEVTRTFRENGLSVAQAEVSTKGETAVNVFYVTDVAGHPVDPNTIEAVRQRIGLSSLKVKEPSMLHQKAPPAWDLNIFSLDACDLNIDCDTFHWNNSSLWLQPAICRACKSYLGLDGCVVLHLVRGNCNGWDLLFFSDLSPFLILISLHTDESLWIVESVREGVTELGDHVLPVFTGECKECAHCKSVEHSMCDLLRINTGRGVSNPRIDLHLGPTKLRKEMARTKIFDSVEHAKEKAYEDKANS
ncbi:hypothetical protein MRB53_025592 [Persea americana]|uniref:Uncharacterized protein n=1 Tax=Persea americana TaxID=3435 RepID=A0ACC2LGA8_PERAE|nr:hypothetical protein MRB53_025592 [Persea americana]